MQELARTLTNKLIHNPSVRMNQAAFEGRKDLLDTARHLLGIKDDEA